MLGLSEQYFFLSTKYWKEMNKEKNKFIIVSAPTMHGVFLLLVCFVNSSTLKNGREVEELYLYDCIFNCYVAFFL